MSGRSSTTLTDAQIVDLAHFLRQRVNDTLRGSPMFQVQNVLTGDAEGRRGVLQRRGQVHAVPLADRRSRRHRHAATSRSNIQQRFLFPRAARRRARARRRRRRPAPSAVTVTVTPPAGPAVTGVLVQMDDFNVTLRDASGEHAHVHADARHCRSSRTIRSRRHVALLETHHRQEHPRRRRLPGDTEMRGPLLACRADCAASPAVSRRAGSIRRSCSNPATDSWPTYNGDYTGRRFSTLTKINDANVKALSLAWVYRLDAGAPAASGRSRRRRCMVNGVDLPHRCPITSGRSTRAPAARSGTYDVAVEGRHPHRQPRRRRSSATALYFETPDCNLVSLEHQGRHRALAQADLRSRPVLLRLGRAGRSSRTTSSPASAATTSTCPATSSRTIPRPASCSGAGTSCRRRRAIPASETLAERRGDAARRRHDVAAGHLRSRAEPDLRHDRQSAAGHRPRQPRRATTSSPPRSSR